MSCQGDEVGSDHSNLGHSVNFVHIQEDAHPDEIAIHNFLD